MQTEVRVNYLNCHIYVPSKHVWRTEGNSRHTYDVTIWLSRTTDNSNIFIRSREVRDNESRLYIYIYIYIYIYVCVYIYIYIFFFIFFCFCCCFFFLCFSTSFPLSGLVAPNIPSCAVLLWYLLWNFNHLITTDYMNPTL